MRREPTGDGKSTRPPVAWLTLLALAAIGVALHLASSALFAYGIFRDELYYLACAEHLDWGYVDQPPLSIAVLWLIRPLVGDSLVALRLVPALAGGALVVLVGLLARQLGGGRAGQGLAGLAALIAPGYLALTGFYSMNALDLVAWAGAALLVARLVTLGGSRLWIGLGVVLGLGLLNKISLLWFGFGLVVGLVLTEHRRWLRTPWPWLAGALALALFAPYVVWNIQNASQNASQNGWPTLEFMKTATAVKMVAAPPWVLLGEQLIVMNPVTAPFWLAGLVYLFAGQGGRLRLLGWIWVAVFGVLVAGGSAKSYYLGGANLILLAAGGVAVERLAAARGRRWPIPAVAAVFAMAGAALAPLAIPLLSPAGLVSYQRTLGLSAPVDEVGAQAALPQHFADRFGWTELVDTVAKSYEALPPEDRERVCIYARDCTPFVDAFR